MDCPKCGAKSFRKSIVTISIVSDPVNKMFYRKCRCTKCGRQFFTVEFEIEYDKDILEAFDCDVSLPKVKVEASKKRFNDFRESQKQIKRMKRWGIK